MLKLMDVSCDARVTAEELLKIRGKMSSPVGKWIKDASNQLTREE